MTAEITIPYSALIIMALSYFIWDVISKLIEAKTGNTPKDKLEMIGIIIDKSTSKVADTVIEAIPKMRFIKNELGPTEGPPRPTAEQIQVDVSEQNSILNTHIEHNTREIDRIREELNLQKEINP